MDEDLITQDMFNALDFDKKGCVSKQHLINQMADYLSENDVSDDAISKISLMNRYPDLIDYEDFKQIYRDLTESNRSNLRPDEESVMYSMCEEIIEENGSDSDVSDNEMWSRLDYDGSRVGLQGSVIDVTESNSQKMNRFNVPQERRRSVASFVPLHECKRTGYCTPSGSMRRRAIDNILSARSSVSTSIGTGYNSMGPDDSKNHEDFDEVSCMTDSGVSIAAEEVDKLVNSYKSVVKELRDLKYKLEDSTKRYQNQREQSKMHNDRIIMLEEQIRQLETLQNEELEFKKKESRSTKNNRKQKRDIQREEESYTDGLFRQEVLRRLNTLESEYNASRTEYERMKHECNIIIKEKENLEKELKLSDKRCHDLELTLQNYKSAVTLQMAELQKERDNAEKINKELYDKLQDTRLSYKCQDSHNLMSPSSTANSPVQNRPVSWTGSFNLMGSSSSKHSLESASGASTSPSCTTISQLERIVHRLTMDNRNLVEKVSHLETLEFYQRQRKTVSNNVSLADEMEQFSVTDLKNALATEREVAKRLQLYIIGLTNRLMLAGYIEAFRHG